MATGVSRGRSRWVLLTRVLLMLWLLALTGILFANGLWGWALVTIAGMVANLVFAYRTSREAVR